MCINISVCNYMWHIKLSSYWCLQLQSITIWIILNGQFHCNPQTLPFTSCLGDVITNLFWSQTQGADLPDQGRCGIDFPTRACRVYNFDLGVELRRHGRGGWCQTNPDPGWQQAAAPVSPLLCWKLIFVIHFLIEHEFKIFLVADNKG